MALWVRISTHAPHAGSDLLLGSVRPSCKHFNPRSPCGERHFLIEDDFLPVGISTHAPHAGSDFVLFEICSRFSNFNPRSPCGERHRHADFHLDAAGFQPTLPMRGATAGWCPLSHADIISTHAPHAGSDVGFSLYRSV